MNKMQHISIAFIDVNSVKFAFSAGLNNINPFCEDTSVNGNVLTNQIYIRLEKTHEVTRCKQTLYIHEDPFTLRTHTHTHINTHAHTHTQYIFIYPLSYSHKCRIYLIKKHCTFFYYLTIKITVSYFNIFFM